MSKASILQDDSVALSAQETLAMRAGFWNTILLPAQFAAGLLFSVLVVRSLEQELYGLYAITVSTASVLLFCSQFGTGGGPSAFYARIVSAQGKRGVFRLMGLTLLARTALLSIVAALPLTIPAVATIMGISAKEKMVFWYAIVIAFMELCASGAIEYLNAIFRRRAVKLIDIFVTLLRPVLLLAVLREGDGLPVVLGVLSFSFCLRAVLLVGVALCASPPRANGEKLLAPLWRVQRLSLVTLVAKVSRFLVSERAIVLMVAVFGTRHDVARAGFAAELVQKVLGFAYAPFEGILVPLLTSPEILQDHQRFRNAFVKLLRAHMYVFVAAGAIFTLGVPWIVRYLYGARFLECVAIIQIFAAMVFLEYCVLGPSTAALVARENIRGYLGSHLLYLVGSAVTIASGTYLGTWTNFVVAVCVVRLLGAICLFAVAAKAEKLRFPAVVFLRNAIPAAAVVLVCQLFIPTSLAAAVAGAGCIVLSLGAVGLHKEERQLLRSRIGL